MISRPSFSRCVGERGLTIGVAESCTGGLLGGRLTAVPGSSDVVLGGVIAYHNDVKRDGLGVTEDALRTYGAVSEEVVRQMAVGARRFANSGVGLAITGVAGPSGGTPEKPVGTVWIAIDIGGEVRTRLLRMWGDRYEIRERSAQWTLEMLRQMLGAAKLASSEGIAVAPPSVSSENWKIMHSRDDSGFDPCSAGSLIPRTHLRIAAARLPKTTTRSRTPASMAGRSRTCSAV